MRKQFCEAGTYIFVHKVNVLPWVSTGHPLWVSGKKCILRVGNCVKDQSAMWWISTKCVNPHCCQLLLVWENIAEKQCVVLMHVEQIANACVLWWLVCLMKMKLILAQTLTPIFKIQRPLLCELSHWSQQEYLWCYSTYKGLDPTTFTHAEFYILQYITS